MKSHPLSVVMTAALLALTIHPAQADNTNNLPPVVVKADKPSMPQGKALGTSDAAQLLTFEPGFSVWSAGGASGLPAMRGLASDRIKILVDGVDATAACGNHMNPPLSYVDAAQVTSAQAIAGLSPVSMGGDNIAGVITVESTTPVFAQAGEGTLVSGQVAATSRSVDKSTTASVQLGLASDTLSVSYSGASTKASSYKDGNGNKVLDTLYKSTNQALLLAAKHGADLWTLRLAEQHIPYQGFANQYMDMTHNHGLSGNATYRGKFDWGFLDANVYAHTTMHRMGFFSDERTGTMPMNTFGRDRGYTIKAELPAWDGTLRVGHDYHRTRLDDWWPAVSGSMMMGPNTFENINNGQRDRVAAFGEWEGAFGAGWTGSAGVRYESVRMNADPVQGYGCGMMCGPDNAAAAAFNAADRAKADHNVDFTVLAKRELSSTQDIELGLARKARSPNLYERYSWGRGTMAMTMIGWFGDGNGYVGDINLKPEVAHTVSATLNWHDETGEQWALALTPYMTYVDNFIDADVIGSFNPYMKMTETKYLMRFANHDAQLFGASLSGNWRVARSDDWGHVTLRGKIDWMRGQRSDGGNLYRIMPPNVNLTLENKRGGLTAYAQWLLVASKQHVDARRDEDKTPGYALLNMGASYQISKLLSVQVGVRNVFDRAYAQPLGGVNLAALSAGASSTLVPIQGQGRSVDLGLSVSF